MRTTLNLDDDALALLRQYSSTRSIAMGKAASELLRKGAQVETPTRLVHGFVVFDLPSDSPRITNDKVKELEAELE